MGCGSSAVPWSSGTLLGSYHSNRKALPVPPRTQTDRVVPPTRTAPSAHAARAAVEELLAQLDAQVAHTRAVEERATENLESARANLVAAQDRAQAARFQRTAVASYLADLKRR